MTVVFFFISVSNPKQTGFEQGQAMIERAHPTAGSVEGVGIKTNHAMQTCPTALRRKPLPIGIFIVQVGPSLGLVGIQHQITSMSLSLLIEHRNQDRVLDVMIQKTES
ncbi:MAG: hypothetical protein ACI87A_003205 [Planctomycetota bacterium]|jgi:hypothetical protein